MSPVAAAVITAEACAATGGMAFFACRSALWRWRARKVERALCHLMVLTVLLADFSQNRRAGRRPRRPETQPPG